MSQPIKSDVLERLVQFVNRRIECIRAGDREGLDATYSPSCLGRRNEYNRHDYEWYLNLIEHGFGTEIERIDLQPLESPANLPFAGMVTYPWPPEYKAFVQTATGRRTLWLIRKFEDDFCVVLPAFDGRTADRVATGEWKVPLPGDQLAETATILEFHPEHFASALAESVSLILDTWSSRLKFETLRAAALDCAPWFGRCYVALLTSKEDFPEDKFGKWAIGDWRLGDLVEVGKGHCQLIEAYYQGKTVTDQERTPAQRAEVIFHCLAQAIQSEVVLSSLNKRYQLADDFELGVFNPDDPRQRNYCARS